MTMKRGGSYIQNSSSSSDKMFRQMVRKKKREKRANLLDSLAK